MQTVGAEIIPKSDFQCNDGGKWEHKSGVLRQTDMNGGSHAILNIGEENFVMEATFRIEEKYSGTDPNLWTEAKFVYSDAEKDEGFRVDFMEKQKWARLSINNLIATAAIFQVNEGVDYHVKIIVKGSYVTVIAVINEEQVVLHNRALFGKHSNGWVGFGTYYGKVSFTGIHFWKLTQREIFVAMQYDGKRDFLYEQVIKTCLQDRQQFDFHFTRLDERVGAGKITEDMDSDIEKADLVIADISEDNRNVFYELGLVHGKAPKEKTARKALLLKEEIEGKPLDLPFDIKDFRTLTYKFRPKEFESLKVILAKAILDSLDLS